MHLVAEVAAEEPVDGRRFGAPVRRGFGHASVAQRGSVEPLEKAAKEFVRVFLAPRAKLAAQRAYVVNERDGRERRGLRGTHSDPFVYQTRKKRLCGARNTESVFGCCAVRFMCALRHVLHERGRRGEALQRRVQEARVAVVH